MSYNTIITVHVNDIHAVVQKSAVRHGSVIRCEPY